MVVNKIQRFQGQTESEFYDLTFKACARREREKTRGRSHICADLAIEL